MKNWLETMYMLGELMNVTKKVERKEKKVEEQGLALKNLISSENRKSLWILKEQLESKKKQGEKNDREF